MDPASGLAIVGSAIGGAKVVEKLLGPTAEYVGVGLKNWTERRVHNVSRIFEFAAKTLGDRIDSPGAVPPKVIKEVLEEGSFNDDELSCEYFGGVLASSRGPIPRDDRGASLMKLVAGLTTYQIRTHYILYTATKRVFDGTGLSLASEENRQKCNMYMSLKAYYQMMEFNPPEDPHSITAHATFGLYQHGLIGNFQFGPQHEMQKQFPHVREAGLQFIPSARGVELFLWACGLGSSPIELFLIPPLILPSMAGIDVDSGFTSLAEANLPPSTSATENA